MSRRDPHEGQFSSAQTAAFGILDAFRDMADSLEGSVTHLKSNGWTDAQARAIVAFNFGWRPADGSKPEGTGP